MTKDILDKYKALKYVPVVGDIVYLGKYYKWLSNPFDWDVSKRLYKVVDIRECIKGIWYNYELISIDYKEHRIEQTHYNLYKKDLLDNLTASCRQLSIFDFL